MLGYDIDADVAVLQLQGASGLSPAVTGDSTKVTVGESVIALGSRASGGAANPGRVTALNQSTTITDESDGRSEHLTGLLEADAPPPDTASGAPLVDDSGAVVGLVAAAPTPSVEGRAGSPPITVTPPVTGPAASRGRSYAVPINVALAIAEQIQAGRSSGGIHIGATAFLGALLSSASSGSSSGGPSAGLAVSGVVANSPVAQAGLVAGDLITAVGGRPVGSASALTAELARRHPGDRVTVTWTDQGGTSHTAPVVLATGPAACETPAGRLGHLGDSFSAASPVVPEISTWRGPGGRGRLLRQTPRGYCPRLITDRPGRPCQAGPDEWPVRRSPLGVAPRPLRRPGRTHGHAGPQGQRAPGEADHPGAGRGDRRPPQPQRGLSGVPTSTSVGRRGRRAVRDLPG